MLSGGSGAGWVHDLCWVVGVGYTFSANDFVNAVYSYPKLRFGEICVFENSGT